MEFTFSLQKLAAYQPRKSGKSKATYDEGLPLLERGGFGKGEEGMYLLYSAVLTTSLTLRGAVSQAGTS